MSGGMPYPQGQYPMGYPPIPGQWPTQPSQAPPKVNKNQVKLPRFSGKESLQSFLNQIDNAARLGAWDAEYKAGQLYAQLTGGALEHVDSLPIEDRMNYERLCAVLKDHYEGDLERDRSKEALRMCRRKRNETIDELGRRIKELTRKAHPADRREEEGVAAMKNAVSDKLSEQIVLQGYKTVDQCVEHFVQN